MVAVAADPLDKGKTLVDKLGPSIHLYEDPGLKTAPAWGAGQVGDDEPTPATYVIGAGGAVLFEHHGGDGGDWPAIADVLAKLP